MSLMAILQQHLKGDNIGPRFYTDEEEKATVINYLKNCSAAKEEPFTEGPNPI